MTNKFRAPNGRRLIESLFYETHRGGETGPVYTLKNQDHKGYLSLYRLYLDCEDPTEFFFAEKHLEDYSHWELLCSCKWFQPYLTRWRKELELKIKAKAIRKLQELADLDGKEALAASKALLDYEKHLEKRTKNPVGRPPKEEPEIIVSVNEDFERLGLTKYQTPKLN